MKKELISTQMNVNNRLVRVMRVDTIDYISLTDLAKYQNENDPSGVIRNWMSNKNSFDFYNLWEELHNENFNSVESHRIKIDEVGYNRFTMTPNRWKKEFNAIGIIPSSGKYSIGTFAHPDIAFEFASWLNVEFKLYLIMEFQRLKQNESYQNKDQNPSLDGNMRDYANILQLVILSNLENLNSEMIAQGIPQNVRLEKLNAIAKKQYNILQDSKGIRKIEMIDNTINTKLLS